MAIEFEREIARLLRKTEQIRADGFIEGADTIERLFTGAREEISKLLDEDKIPAYTERSEPRDFVSLKEMFLGERPKQIDDLLADTSLLYKLSHISRLEQVIALGKKLRSEVVSKFSKDQPIVPGRRLIFMDNPLYRKLLVSQNDSNKKLLSRVMNKLGYHVAHGGFVAEKRERAALVPTIEDIESMDIDEILGLRNFGLKGLIVFAYAFGKYETPQA